MARDLFAEAGVEPTAASAGPRDLFAEAGIEGSVSAGRAINSIPRQIGLTARYGLEGLAQAAQIGTEPLRYLTDRLTGQTGKTVPLGVLAGQAADKMGLPSPQTANERVIGDASRLVAGGAGLAGGAGALVREAPGAISVGQNLLRGLSANPAQQAGAAAGAGLAGGASREAGGDPLMQAGAALLGGVAGGSVPTAGSAVLNAGRSLLRPKLTDQQIDVKLTALLGGAGTDYTQIPGNVKGALRTELRSSLQAGKELNPEAVSRLADFRAVGATPTRGMISQNPVQITREQNLAKMAANSADGELHGLPLMQNENNRALIGRLNTLGGGTETDPITAGRLVSDRIAATDKGFQVAEKAAWETAKGLPGYKQPIFPDGLNAINKALQDEGQMLYMNPQISKYMEAFQTGQQPFTPQAYRNLQSALSKEMAAGGNSAAAAGTARRALESTPMVPLTATGRDIGTAPVTQQMAAALRAQDAQPKTAIDAVNAARAATAAKYGYQEGSPLVRTALSGARTADPEKIAQSFVIGGTLNDAKTVAREVGPEGIAVIRDTLATHIKKQALSGANDEVGKVSQSALNRTLNKIGDEKLSLFFSPEELTSLRATGRVASLMQVQPVGSAVNNSNSGALLLGRGLDAMDKKLGLLPFGGLLKMGITEPARNINFSLSQRQAQNVLPGLLRERPMGPAAPPLLLPATVMGAGLLSAP